VPKSSRQGRCQHVASTREFGFVAHSVGLLAAHCVDLSYPRCEFTLNVQGDRHGHRRHHLDQQAGDRRIDDFAGNRLADLSSATQRGLLTDIGQPHQHATLE
jgi:hypothetical protein